MKLVRDKIPEIIVSSGKKPIVRAAAPNLELPLRLYQKMIEEMNEFFEEPSIEEAGDMLEVFLALMKIYNFEMVDVFTARRDVPHYARMVPVSAHAFQVPVRLWVTSSISRGGNRIFPWLAII